MGNRRNLKFKTLAFIGISTVLHAGFLVYLVASNYGSDTLSDTTGGTAETVEVDFTSVEPAPPVAAVVVPVKAPKIITEVVETKTTKLPAKSPVIEKTEIPVVAESPESIPVSVAAVVPVEEQLAEQIQNDVVTPAPETTTDASTEATAVVPAVVEDPAPIEAAAAAPVSSVAALEASAPGGNTADAVSSSAAIMPIRQDSELKAMPGNQDPQYAFDDRLAKREGEIKFLAEVTPEGAVTNVRMLKSTGHKTLDMAALKSFKSYRYQPGQQGYVLKSFNFVLKGPARQLPSRLADRAAPSLAK